MVKDIVNFQKVGPNLATAGQPTPEQLAKIREAGYEVVINLLPPDHPEGLNGEGELVTSLGMDYINIPVVWTNPTAENLQDFFQAMQSIRGRKVFVHCMMNYRASAFTFLYRVLVEKQPVEDAEPAMRKIWAPYDAWPEFIEEQLKEA
jgi:protein tyrosine phosphatase (PTP) superfamily phosphohydrolase (DUF442 family)